MCLPARAERKSSAGVAHASNRSSCHCNRRFPLLLGAQSDPLPSFPLHVGSRWVYEHEWKSGDSRRPNVERWMTEESITGWLTLPEGLVVLRDVRRTTRPVE